MDAPERLNVLLSRARDGLILIGNSDTFLHSRKGGPLWRRFFTLVNDARYRYNGFPAKCERHPWRVVLLKRASDFDDLCPDGGCTEPCGFTRACGHVCPLRCHPHRPSASLDPHDASQCGQPMNAMCPADQHRITWKCGRPAYCAICAEEAKRLEEIALQALEQQRKHEAAEAEHRRRMAELEAKLQAEKAAEEERKRQEERRKQEEELRSQMEEERKRREEELKSKREEEQKRREEVARQRVEKRKQNAKKRRQDAKKRKRERQAELRRQEEETRTREEQTEQPQEVMVRAGASAEKESKLQEEQCNEEMAPETRGEEEQKTQVGKKRKWQEENKRKQEERKKRRVENKKQEEIKEREEIKKQEEIKKREEKKKKQKEKKRKRKQNEKQRRQTEVAGLQAVRKKNARRRRGRRSNISLLAACV
ncbi:hypothetical protein HD554DRAFT_2276579 [Boletus coccyginus]|nr:hypothetical protein HD554DRAFT_2276579 [Boletus coccyginus]